jgi:hypothetical protein
MKPITIPLHFLIPTAVSLAGLIFMLLKRNTLKKKDNALYKSVLIFLSAYALVVGNALGHDLYYQWDLNRYDLDRNGFFSQAETIPVQLLAMERLMNDTGRSSSYISAFIASSILSVCVYIVLRISNALLATEDNEDKNHINNVHT